MPLEIRTVLAAMAALVLTAGVALAADTPPPPATPGAKAVVARQANYRQLGEAFVGLTDEAKKDAPDKAVIAADAVKLKALAADLPTWFPKGSGPEAGVKTRAKPEIWTDAEGFDTAATRLRDETAKLQEVSAAGDIEAIRTQRRATAAACKTCHDRYQEADRAN
jgi:cytochrome c556